MEELIDEMEVTWTVAFTEEPCLNPHFGVLGIPYLAIIDPEGVVRFAGLTPFMPLERKALAIGALLEEFGKGLPPG